MKAIQVEAHGGPEVLELCDVPDPVPKPDEAIVEMRVSGVNFIDVYHRRGAFDLPTPFIPGSEGAGTVISVGSNGPPDLLGRRVVFVTYPALQGTYAERVRVKTWRLVPIPDGLDERAACTLMTGMTAHYLAHDVRSFEPGQWALVHAAAGGVGSLLVQMLSRSGVRVIAAASTEEKAQLARSDGAEEVVTTGDAGWVGDVRETTGGVGVDAVFDSVGKATFDGSLECLRRRGWMILFGIASGEPRDLPPEELLHRGSLVLTRPGLVDYTATPDELQRRAADVLHRIDNGDLKVRIQEVFPLTRAADAHRCLEARATTGKLLLNIQEIRDCSSEVNGGEARV